MENQLNNQDNNIGNVAPAEASQPMPTKKPKKVIFFIVGVLAAIVGIIGLVFFLSGDAIKSADNFFSMVKSGNVDGAYQSTSQQFKQKTTIDQFKSFIEGYPAVDFGSAVWTSREIDTTSVTLSGSFKANGNNVAPLKVVLVKEDETWRILSIDILGGVAQQKIIPSNADLIILTDNTILSFATAVKNDDFSSFYGSISKLWQNQISEQQLKNIFKSFIDSKNDLTVLKGVTPVFSDKPVIQDSGVLVLNGYYLYKGSELDFVLKYVYEDKNWKLSGINIEIK